jgi:hypothetical protein
MGLEAVCEEDARIMDLVGVKPRRCQRIALVRVSELEGNECYSLGELPGLRRMLRRGMAAARKVEDGQAGERRNNWIGAMNGSRCCQDAVKAGFGSR